MTQSKKETTLISIPVFLTFIWLSISSPSEAALNIEDLTKNKRIEVKVLYVLDGDSIVIRFNGGKITVRLWGIDAPEHDQNFSKESKHYLQLLTGKKNVFLTYKYRDKYNRVVAIVENDRYNVNEYMISSGYAWVHRYYCDTEPCGIWKTLEKNARENEMGLWKNENPIPPWVWKNKK